MAFIVIHSYIIIYVRPLLFTDRHGATDGNIGRDSIDLTVAKPWISNTWFYNSQNLD